MADGVEVLPSSAENLSASASVARVPRMMFGEGAATGVARAEGSMAMTMAATRGEEGKYIVALVGGR